MLPPTLRGRAWVCLSGLIGRSPCYWHFSPLAAACFSSLRTLRRSPLCLPYLQASLINPHSRCYPLSPTLCSASSHHLAPLLGITCLLSSIPSPENAFSCSESLKQVAPTGGGFVLRYKRAWRSVDVAFWVLVLSVRAWVCGVFLSFSLMVVKGLLRLPALWLKAGGEDGPGSIPFYLGSKLHTSPPPPPAPTRPHQPAAHFRVCNLGHL